MWVPLLALPLLIGGVLNELYSFNFFMDLGDYFLPQFSESYHPQAIPSPFLSS